MALCTTALIPFRDRLLLSLLKPGDDRTLRGEFD
jgi:hypothetical protein